MKSFLILFYVLIHSLTFVSCHRVIRLGALFSDTEKDSEVEFAFKYAIDRINRDPHLLPNTTLVSDIEYIPVSDSFRASKKGKSFSPADRIIKKYNRKLNRESERDFFSEGRLFSTKTTLDKE